ncbi:hypothetical protein BH11CYA1_BH11CYA1_16170 [soil metagenome]
MSLPNQGNLPSFDRPPVSEVALSVQFDKVANLRSFQLATLWKAFSAQFPQFEEHPPLAPVVEQLKMGPQSHRIEFSLLQLPEVPRYFFVSQSGNELIQVQQDRFGHNWRKSGDGDEYPRYEKIRSQFKANLELFCEFLASESLGRFSPTQVDITYVNHIVSGEGWEKFGEIQKVMNVQALEYSDSFLMEAESISHSERHIIRFADKPVGRLHITAEPAYRAADGKPILNLNLIARGFPLSGNIDGVLNFLDLGREYIVRGFASVTRPEMHKIWGRTK